MSRSSRSETSDGLTATWEAHAEQWTRWAREPGHDSYWLYHRDVFRDLLPPPAGRALDVGCGEGRLPRDLKAWGYEVVGIDASPTLIQFAREADPTGDYRVADAAELPFESSTFALVTAFMSLHDVDDLDGAVEEIARVLEPRGVFCAAIVHPINSAGRFQSSAPDAPFVIEGSYLEPHRYADVVERDGLSMTFASAHRPLQSYFELLSRARLVVDRLVEVPDLNDQPGSRWRRVPLFLQFRALKT